jgi:hypothetical protein
MLKTPVRALFKSFERNCPDHGSETGMGTPLRSRFAELKGPFSGVVR